MVGIKKVGSILGKVAGTVTGEPIKFIGKKLNNDYIQDIGDGVKKASSNSGTILGGLAEGAWNTTSGIIQKDEQKRDEGLVELKNTTVKTAKGVGQSIKHTYASGQEIIQGAKSNDKQQMINGAKGIGKTVAVAAFAVGVLDVLDVIDLDGVDNHVQADGMPGNADIQQLDTRNDALVGQTHPDTGIEFVSKTITLPSGEVVEGVFPQFESEYTASLPQSMYLESDDVQFSTANEQLAQAIQQDPKLAAEFTKEQQVQIFYGETPEGYTWHHSEQPGQLQLVDQKVHAETGHTGGREIWGGGSEYR